MFYYTYVLWCWNQDIDDGEFYIGYCKDLKVRFSKHLSGSVTTTEKFKNVRLVYYEACLNKRDAKAREEALKTGFGRAYLKRRLKYSSLRQ